MSDPRVYSRAFGPYPSWTQMDEFDAEMSSAPHPYSALCDCNACEVEGHAQDNIADSVGAWAGDDDGSEGMRPSAELEDMETVRDVEFAELY